MGIDGLLQNVKSLITRRHINDFSGLKVAIDGYWYKICTLRCVLLLYFIVLL